MLANSRNNHKQGSANEAPASLSLKRIELIRKEIDSIDQDLSRLLERRLELAQTLGSWKNEMGLPIKDADREKRVLEGIKDRLPDSKLIENVLALYSAILKESCKVQER